MANENTALMKTKGNETTPQLLVLAGPNGSGKSTIAKCVEAQGLFINADEIKAQNNSLSDLEAAIEAEALREYCLKSRLSFSYEPFVIYSKDSDGREVISENKYWTKDSISILIHGDQSAE